MGGKCKTVVKKSSDKFNYTYVFEGLKKKAKHKNYHTIGFALLVL